ncbi:MAG: hypothetical protein ACJ8FY_11230 [Gemmataceae bacterium]
MERFIADVCQGGCCFVCGAKPGTKPFNDEHVVPQWLLRKHGLYRGQVGLPNGTSIKYSQYTIPCCEDCNGILGQEIESPISNVLTGGYDSTVEFVKANGPWMLFSWMALLFIKTHLKDGKLRMHRDRRMANTTIADGSRWNWETIHVVHSIATAAYSKCVFVPSVLGSTHVFLVRDKGDGAFDYCDFYYGNAVMVRIGDVAILVVLDDACEVSRRGFSQLVKVGGPLGKLQVKEVFAYLAYSNMRINPRPEFGTVLDPVTGKLLMGVKIPSKYDHAEFVPRDFGEVMYSICYDELSKSDRGKEILQKIRIGKGSFVFDERGEFVERPGHRTEVIQLGPQLGGTGR